MFGVGANDAMVADPNRFFVLDKADLVVPNELIQKLFHDLTFVSSTNKIFKKKNIIDVCLGSSVELVLIQTQALLVQDKHFGLSMK